ncbi:MAG: hypothetical protein BMS9Abin34_247 [Patescibacteria group bacterium]|nr:MAG: hypothetical protein BMS9Abin34_247 [Patescibacteria group bacterium]
MFLSLLCAVGSVFGLIVLYVVLRYDGIDQSFCPSTHHVGPVNLTHHSSIECSTALKIAQMAREIWENSALKDDFPSETSQGFELEVIFDPKKGPGYKPWGISRAVVNLSGAYLYFPYPGNKAGNHSLKGTIAEELHHICRFRRLGDEKQVFKYDPEDGPIGVTLYYALNPLETEALRFVVKSTGDRANLLREVEEHFE